MNDSLEALSMEVPDGMRSSDSYESPVKRDREKVILTRMRPVKRSSARVWIAQSQVWHLPIAQLAAMS
jgi:hypothetical protein